jgi:hypothetical protein
MCCFWGELCSSSSVRAVYWVAVWIIVYSTVFVVSVPMLGYQSLHGKLLDAQVVHTHCCKLLDVQA